MLHASLQATLQVRTLSAIDLMPCKGILENAMQTKGKASSNSAVYRSILSMKANDARASACSLTGGNHQITKPQDQTIKSQPHSCGHINVCSCNRKPADPSAMQYHQESTRSIVSHRTSVSIVPASARQDAKNTPAVARASASQFSCRRTATQSTLHPRAENVPSGPSRSACIAGLRSRPTCAQ